MLVKVGCTDRPSATQTARMCMTTCRAYWVLRCGLPAVWCCAVCRRMQARISVRSRFSGRRAGPSAVWCWNSVWKTTVMR